MIAAHLTPLIADAGTAAVREAFSCLVNLPVILAMFYILVFVVMFALLVEAVNLDTQPTVVT